MSMDLVAAKGGGEFACFTWSCQEAIVLLESASLELCYKQLGSLYAQSSVNAPKNDVVKKGCILLPDLVLFVTVSFCEFKGWRVS